MEVNEIITRIQSGLKFYSEKYSIPARDIKIKIAREETKGIIGTSVAINFYVMNANEMVKGADGKNEKVDVKEFFGLDAIKALLVTGYLKDTFSSLAKKNNISISKVNAHIFTKTPDFTPSVNLYEGEQIKKEITVEELTTK